MDDPILGRDHFQEVGGGKFGGSVSRQRELFEVQDCFLDLGIGIKPDRLRKVLSDVTADLVQVIDG
ncbi:hypothetical protein D3C87_1844610 [compost metagenome]